ncbi:hypothetical protein ACFWNT_41870, partial [Streptomyces sp. NPDC058409]|uniref:hypothetical protein n=1 Tax=Streptomyces sp. NPDC058409 TaxID=3346484 RepID=UPI003665594D
AVIPRPGRRLLVQQEPVNMSLPPLPHMMKPKSVLTDSTVENTERTPLWEVLVPVSNVGKPFTVRHHRQWDAHVKQITGGMTLISPSGAPGATTVRTSPSG